MTLTRRKWFQEITGIGVGIGAMSRRATAATDQRLRVDQLLADNSLTFSNTQTRTYRADVVVAVLGVPIFSRQAVGGAVAILREASQGDKTVTCLQFCGGANPQRTHGIRYSGCTEEVIQLLAAEPIQAAYFGFVTAPPSNQAQESFEQARQRVLSANSHPAGAYVAVEGSHQPGTVQNNSATFPVTAPDWGEWPELIREVRSEFVTASRSASATHQEVRCEAGSVASTFLYAVLAASRANGKTSRPYFHNAKPYRLDCEKTQDHHAGAKATRLTGQIHDLTKGHTSTFRVWLEEGSDLPVRIEFSPRPYLRINLEMDSTVEISMNREDA
jgi:hypothetical protein